MDLIRIGDKLVSLGKIDQTIRDLLDDRAQGMSQGEVAVKHHIDRAFLSHLEGLGAIRKGRSIAVVGFPVANKIALEEMLQGLGVDRVLLMTDRERRRFAEERSGVALVNEIMRLAQSMRRYDVVVLLASESRLHLLRALVDSNKEVIPLTLGKGPFDHDVEVDLERVRVVVEACKHPNFDNEPAM